MITITLYHYMNIGMHYRFVYTRDTITFRMSASLADIYVYLNEHWSLRTTLVVGKGSEHVQELQDLCNHFNGKKDTL